MNFKPSMVLIFYTLYIRIITTKENGFYFVSIISYTKYGHVQITNCTGKKNILIQNSIIIHYTLYTLNSIFIELTLSIPTNYYYWLYNCIRTAKQYFSKFHKTYIMLNMIYMLFLVKQERVNRQKALLYRHNIIILYGQMCRPILCLSVHRTPP